MKRHYSTLIIGTLLVLIFGLLLLTFQVRQSEVAVVTTFGNPTREITEPRAFPFLKWPWPIQRVYKLDQRIQTFEDRFSEELTRDGISLMSSVYVGWRITEPMTFFPKFAGGSTNAAERLLQNLLQTAKSSVVGKHNLADFVNANPAQLKFDEIESEISGIVERQLESGQYGIKIEFLGLKRLGFPESVTESVFEQMKSERNVLATRTTSEGEAEAQKIKSTANREASRLVDEAEARAVGIRAEGEKIAAELLPVFEQNPELAAIDLRLKALEQVLKENTMLIFDPRTPPFDSFGGFLTNRISR